MMYPMIKRGRADFGRKSRRTPKRHRRDLLYGYGWPIYRGGPMFYADQVGLKHIAERAEFLRQGNQRPVARARAAAQASRG